MIRFLLIYQLLASNICYGEGPKFHCQIDKPYKSKDNLCTDFVDICVKKDDPDCLNFQSACQQCPPSNYSIMMFIDMMKVKNELITTKSQLKNLTVQIEDQAAKTIDILVLVVVSLIIIILSTVIIILEVRFKIITKLIHLKKKRYALLPSSNQSIEQNIASNINEINQKLANIINNSIPSTEFFIEGYEKPIKYNLNTKDTVIKIKRELCDQFIENKNYKLMKMKHKDSFLDDNENLFNKFSSSNTTINCEFDTSIDANDILVLNLRGNIDVPKYFQIDKSLTIDDLKRNLANIKVIDGIKIFKESEELQNDFSLTKLNDNDCLYLIKEKVEELKLSSMFILGNSVVVNHNHVEKIEKMKIDIADQCSSTKENFFIILKNQYLDENKYLFQYNMDYKEDLKYCCFIKFHGFGEFKSIYKEPLYELFTTFEGQNKEVLLKKYCLSKSKDNLIETENVKDNKYLLKELATFQITKSQKRFVQLLNIYKKNSDIYISMENMAQGTIIKFLNENNSIENVLVSKWVNQILEGLVFLHNKKIIYRTFSPSCILVNKDNDVKLHGLNLSKYTNFNEISSLMSNNNSEELPIRYLSPEIINNKNYNAVTDVWSFGAVLIFITTGKDPFPNIANAEVIDKIRNNSKIEYHIPDKYKNSKLAEFIDCCLKYDPKERPSCSKLKNHDFIDKQLEN